VISLLKTLTGNIMSSSHAENNRIICDFLLHIFWPESGHVYKFRWGGPVRNAV